MIEKVTFAPKDITDMCKITITVQAIRWAYPLLNKYFGFEYESIGDEIFNSMYEYFDYQTEYLETRKIDHLPDDFEIYFSADYDKFMNLMCNHEFLYVPLENGDANFCITLMLLSIYSQNLRNYFYGVIEGAETQALIDEEKRKLYEFLLDNPHNFKYSNLAIARMEIRYGGDSQITVDNYDNWLYNLLKKELHDHFTLGGKLEYNRFPEESQKPTRAPSFGNFISYPLATLRIFRASLP